MTSAEPLPDSAAPESCGGPTSPGADALDLALAAHATAPLNALDLRTGLASPLGETEALETLRQASEDGRQVWIVVR